MSQGQRQLPGLACEGCRRRKARCDRARPSCGSCEDSGARCQYVDKRPQRGPRKGQMMALMNLVANLEQRLGEQTGQQQQSEQNPAPTHTSEQPETAPEPFVMSESDPTLPETVPTTFAIDMDRTDFSSAPFDGTSLTSTSLGSTSLSSASLEATPFVTMSMTNTDLTSTWGLDVTTTNAMPDQLFVGDWLDETTIMSPTTTPTGAQQVIGPKQMESLGGSTLSDVIQSDLDELYFDRVHPVAPSIHKRNYFAWANRKCPSSAQMALQYAMRAVAAAMSTQYRPLSGMLCGESRRLLKQMDANIANECCDIAIEQIQAWLLVAHWELLCANEHQAMLTAGRAIRMVQLSRLHDIDSSSATFHSFGKETSLYPPSPLSEEECFASLEEKRRTFWLAYCFDRFCLLHNECQPYLQEESIRTRLPAPESNFQNNQPVRMEFLSESLATNGRTMLPMFAKCVVLISLFGRCMSHQRLALTDPIPDGNDCGRLWSKYAWLALAVEKGKQLLVRGVPVAGDYTDDPMLIYVHALAACATIYVYQSMAGAMGWTTGDHELAAPPYAEQAIQAASELIHLVKLMPRSVCHVKAHPFLPTLIDRAAAFLMSLPPSPTYSGRDDDLNTLLAALRNLQQMNNLSRSILCKLEQNALCVRYSSSEPRDGGTANHQHKVAI